MWSEMPRLWWRRRRLSVVQSVSSGCQAHLSPGGDSLFRYRKLLRFHGAIDPANYKDRALDLAGHLFLFGSQHCWCRRFSAPARISSPLCVPMGGGQRRAHLLRSPTRRSIPVPLGSLKSFASERKTIRPTGSLLPAWKISRCARP